jgi:hypothetical protein
MRPFFGGKDGFVKSSAVRFGLCWRFQQAFGRIRALAVTGVILSLRVAIPTGYLIFMGPYFQRLSVGQGDALPYSDEVARNGALVRINFGQRFSRASLAFFVRF